MKVIFKGIIEELSQNKKHQHLYIKRTFLSQPTVKETRIMAKELQRKSLGHMNTILSHVVIDTCMQQKVIFRYSRIPKK